MSSICRNLLARGIKAAGLGIVRFGETIGHAFSYHAICGSFIEAQIGRWSAPPGPLIEIRFHTNNPFIVTLALEAQKNTKNWSQNLQKTRNSRPRLITNDFCEKLTFAIPYLWSPRIWSPERRNFDTDIDEQSGLETSLRKKWNFKPRCPKKSQTEV